MTKFTISLIASAATLFLGACGEPKRELPSIAMPIAPKECSQVLGFEVQPLSKGKSDAAKIAIELAKEGGTRQQEHEISKTCARYALRTEKVMQDGNAKRTPSILNDDSHDVNVSRE